MTAIFEGTWENKESASKLTHEAFKRLRNIPCKIAGSRTIFIPQEVVNSEGYKHNIDGKHGAFTGRPYRRGKNRCKFCGAPLTAGDK